MLGVELLSIPGWGTGLGSVPFPRRVPIVPEGSLVPGKGSPPLRGGPIHPTESMMSPRVLTASQCLGDSHSPKGSPFLEWVPTAWGVEGAPFFLGQFPSVPRTPYDPPPSVESPVPPVPPLPSHGPHCPLPSPHQGFTVSGGSPCLRGSPLSPTHLAALTGAHSVVVPRAAVAAHEARLVHAGRGRRRGGGRVPHNPPRGGLQGWGGKKVGGVKQPRSTPLQRGPSPHREVGETKAQGGVGF